MPSRIFRFYSLEPAAIFRMASDRWPSAIVRRSGWKVGGSPLFYVTVVLDDLRAGDEFEQWLARNTPRRNIRRYFERGVRDPSNAVYEDVRLHHGGLLSRLNLRAVTLRRDVGHSWLGVSRSMRRLWVDLKS